MWYKVKRIYQWTNLVRPVWKPNANTIAYYPLDTNFNDYMWNYNMATKAGSPSITTLNWVKCCYFNGSSDIGNDNLHTNTIWANFTLSWWVNIPANKELALFTCMTTSLWWRTICYNTEWNITLSRLSSSNTVTIKDDTPIPASTWTHICTISDNGTFKLYQNWVLAHTQTVNPWLNTNWLARIWGNNYNEWAWDRWFSTWYASRVIIENKVRTAQEVDLYYRTTKSNYWL